MVESKPALAISDTHLWAEIRADWYGAFPQILLPYSASAHMLL